MLEKKEDIFEEQNRSDDALTRFGSVVSIDEMENPEESRKVEWTY